LIGLPQPPSGIVGRLRFGSARSRPFVEGFWCVGGRPLWQVAAAPSKRLWGSMGIASWGGPPTCQVPEPPPFFRIEVWLTLPPPSKRHQTAHPSYLWAGPPSTAIRNCLRAYRWTSSRQLLNSLSFVQDIDSLRVSPANPGPSPTNSQFHHFLQMLKHIFNLMNYHQLWHVRP
jgi:hypothetical protein